MQKSDIEDILEDARNAGVPEDKLTGLTQKKWPQAADRDQVIQASLDAKVGKARAAGATEEDIARTLDNNPQARERNSVEPAENPSGYQYPEEMEWVPEGEEFAEDVPQLPEDQPAVERIEWEPENPEYTNLDAAQAASKGNAKATHFETRANNGGIFPHIANEGGSISTHRMAAEVDEDTGKWYVFPTIVQNEDGSLTPFEDGREAMRHNMRTGNIKEMPSKEEALEYAQGGYKKGTYMEEKEKTLVDELHRDLLTPPTHTDTTQLEEVKVRAKRNNFTPHPLIIEDLYNSRFTPPESTDAINKPKFDGFHLEYSRDMAILNAAIPMLADEQGDYVPPVDFWESAGFMFQDYGVTTQGARMIEELNKDYNSAETDKIYQARHELFYGVSEEYHDWILIQPTLRDAEIQAARLRTAKYREGVLENESFMMSIGTGFVGYVADPLNIVGGGVALQGLKFIAKGAAWAGVKYTGKRKMTKEIAQWAAVGGTEELLRLAPKLINDPTYTMDRYLLDSAMGMAFGGAMPALVPAAKGIGRGTGRVGKEVIRVGQNLGVDQGFKSAANTAAIMFEQTGKGKGIIDKIKQISPGQAYREGAEKARLSIDNKVRELRDYDVGPQIHTAVDSMDDKAATEVGVSLFQKVAQAIDARTGGGLAARIAEITEVLRQPEPAVTRSVDDAGNAPKKPGEVNSATPVAPEPSVQDTARLARRKVREASEAAYRLIDESDATPEVKARLYNVVRAARQQAENGIETAMRKNGVAEKRQTLNNKDHTSAVLGAIDNVRGAIKSQFRSLGKAITDLPQLNLHKRANGALSRAMKAAGVTQEAGENITAALHRKMKGMSHKQRENFVSKMTTEWTNNVHQIRGELDADPRLEPEQLAQVLAELDEAERVVRNQLELANVLARNPYEDALVVKAEWAQVAEEWRKTGNMEELGKQYRDSLTQYLAKHQFGILTESLASRMIKSGGPIAQYFAHTVLESPSGFGGKVKRSELTAAIFAENLDAKSREPVLNMWKESISEYAAEQGWSRLQRVKGYMGSAKTHDTVKQFAQEVQLEIDARRLGISRDSGPAVKKMADQLEKSYADLHDLQNGHVAGITDGNKLKHYQHQVWDDNKLLALLGDDAGRKGVIDLLSQAIMRGVPDAKPIPGMTPGKGKGIDPAEARVLATALVEQKVAVAARSGNASPMLGDDVVEGMMPELETILAKAKGPHRETILKIMKAMNEQLSGETPGYAKTRVPLDLSATAMIGGKEVRMIDLMDSDVPAIFMRYSKEATARTAISKSTGGRLNSDKAMSEMLMAMQLEAQELGINVDSVGAKNALMILMGKQYDGQLPMDVRRARDAVALAGMGGLGESQLAEFGLAVGRGIAGLVGVMNKSSTVAGKFRKFRGLELTEEQANSTQFLGELQEMSGLLQEMYKIDRPNVHFDQENTTRSGISGFVDFATGGKYRPLLQHLQTRMTGYGVIRQFEDQVAMASLTHDLIKFFDGRSSFSSPERLIDLGVPIEADSWLAKRMAEATRTKNGNVQSLNSHTWSQLERDKFGVILNRYASQQVQKGFVGEMSPEMMNPWVAFMMQFKSYPILAAEKQGARHLKFADKEAGVSMMLNVASSAIARVIRYQSVAAGMRGEEREEYLDKKMDDLMNDTMMYTGVLGTLFTGADIASGAITDGVGSQLPVLNYMDKYRQALGAPADGDISQRDTRNMQVALPLGTTSFGNLLFNGIRRSMDEDE